MNWTEFCEAVDNAELIERRAQQAAGKLARLLVGRLRISGIPGYVLADLKKELRGFNSVTEIWKD